MELKITKEKILEVAGKCSTAKATLEVLFPEVFKEEEKGIVILAGKGRYNNSVLAYEKDSDDWIVALPYGEPQGTKIQLSSSYRWELTKDGSFDYLTPKRK